MWCNCRRREVVAFAPPLERAACTSSWSVPVFGTLPHTNHAIPVYARLMCGRFIQKLSPRAIHDLYGVTGPPPSLARKRRYNGAPTQEFAVCRVDDDGRRRVAELRWGLVPSWWRDAGAGPPLINARAETILGKRAFADAFRQRRCLVPADGWFEWRGPAGARQPYHLSLADESPLSFAAIWERWAMRGDVVESFAILTTPASAELADIHDRQPAIVDPEWFAEWLDPTVHVRALLPRLGTPHAGPYARQAVGTRVNSVLNDDPDILRPVGEQLRLI